MVKGLTKGRRKRNLSLSTYYNIKRQTFTRSTCERTNGTVDSPS